MRTLDYVLKVLLAVVLTVTVAGCGDDTTANGDMPAADLSAIHDQSVAGDLALLSRCGHPGDTGNSKGVGKFCTGIGDCPSNLPATLCSSLGNGGTPSASDSYFCTLLNCKTDMANACGENASCQCAPQGCACVPDRCLAAGDM